MSNDDDNPDRIATSIGEMWVDEGILWHRVDALEVTAESVSEVKEAILRLSGGQPMPSIVDIRAVAYADLDSREGFAFLDDPGLETATALIVFNSASSAMAHLFLRGEQNRPVRVFVDPDEAEAWARTFLTT